MNSDTDSLAIAIAGETLDACVRPELKDEFYATRKSWLSVTEEDRLFFFKMYSCNLHFDFNF